MLNRLTATQLLVPLFAAIFLSGAPARAAETENRGMRVFPVPREVIIDGKAADGDPAGGIFRCSDVEFLREKGQEPGSTVRPRRRNDARFFRRYAARVRLIIRGRQSVGIPVCPG